MSTISASQADYLRRELSSGALIEFEQNPAGSVTKDGKIRRRDHRAYYWTAPGEQPKRQKMTSVSTLLDAILPKPGLSDWAEARGIEGTMIALQQDQVDLQVPAQEAIEKIRSLGLGAHGARKKAASRGLDIHGLLGEYMATGELPRASLVKPENTGYYQALCRSLAEEQPEPLQIEELVCHPEQRYAGRSDLVALHDGLRTRYEYKTNARGQIFASAHLQTALYEHAAISDDDEPCDMLRIIVLSENGDWQAVPVAATDASVEAALGWWKALRPINTACAAQQRAHVAG